MNKQEYLGFWKRETTRNYIKNLDIAELELKLPPNVFDPDPDITYSTSIILDHFPDVKEKTVLDLGTGSGIIALKACKSGAKLCVASDIDAKVLRSAKVNFEKNECNNEIVVIWSNLFQNIYSSFDVIFANLPIWDDQTFDTHLELLRNYQRHLNPGGELWMSYASFGDPRMNPDFLHASYPVKDIIEETKFGIKWSLYVLKKE